MFSQRFSNLNTDEKWLWEYSVYEDIAGVWQKGHCGSFPMGEASMRARVYNQSARFAHQMFPLPFCRFMVCVWLKLCAVFCLIKIMQITSCIASFRINNTKSTTPTRQQLHIKSSLFTFPLFSKLGFESFMTRSFHRSKVQSPEYSQVKARSVFPLLFHPARRSLKHCVWNLAQGSMPIMSYLISLSCSGDQHAHRLKHLKDNATQELLFLFRRRCLWARQVDELGKTRLQPIVPRSRNQEPNHYKPQCKTKSSQSVESQQVQKPMRDNVTKNQCETTWPQELTRVNSTSSLLPHTWTKHWHSRCPHAYMIPFSIGKQQRFPNKTRRKSERLSNRSAGKQGRQANNGCLRWCQTHWCPWHPLL